MFRPDDIESSLFYSSGQQAGAYDNLQWSVLPGNDHTELFSRIVSVHEYLHHDLNNVTGYGVILFGYAYMSRQESAQKSYYNNMLYELVEKCRFAHEAYATWYSISMFKKSAGDMLEAEVLADNRYRQYYDCAALLALNIKSLFLQQQVVSSAIRFCFQSRKIADCCIGNIQAFSPRLISGIEFPDNRFQYITTQLRKDFFVNALNECFGSLKTDRERELLKAGLSGKEDLDKAASSEKDHLADSIMRKVHAKLQEHFEGLGSPSLNSDEHLIYLKKQVQLLTCLFPDAQSDLLFHEDMEDAERTALLNFENETLLLTRRPLQCFLLDHKLLNEQEKKEVLHGAGDIPHIFIMGRNPLFMQNQYRFSHKESEEWFSSRQEPFTAIRYAGEIGGKRTVIMVPFDEPSQLIAFLRERNPSVQVLGCVSVGAAHNEKWWNMWGDFFSTHCDFSCILMDVSPLYYVEQGFAGDSVFYSTIVVETPTTTYSGMLFQLKDADGGNTIMLAPGSAVYCQMLHYYIRTRYPAYINKILLNDTEESAFTIFSHIVREEYAWFFNAQDLNKKAFPAT